MTTDKGRQMKSSDESEGAKVITLAWEKMVINGGRYAETLMEEAITEAINKARKQAVLEFQATLARDDD